MQRYIDGSAHRALSTGQRGRRVVGRAARTNWAARSKWRSVWSARCHCYRGRCPWDLCGIRTNRKLGGKTIQCKNHMLFINVLAVNAQRTRLSAKGAESAHFVDAPRCLPVDCDGELDRV